MYTGRSPVDWEYLSPKLKVVHNMFGCGQIKLLVAQSFKDDSSRQKAQDWAVDEGIFSSFYPRIINILAVEHAWLRSAPPACSNS